MGENKKKKNKDKRRILYVDFSLGEGGTKLPFPKHIFEKWPTHFSPSPCIETFPLGKVHLAARTKTNKIPNFVSYFFMFNVKGNFSLCCTWRRAERKLMTAIISRLRTHTAARQIHRLSKPFFYLGKKTLYSLLYLVYKALLPF